jgi:hypothetical protein
MDQDTEPMEEGTAVLVVEKNPTPLDSAEHDVVEGAGKVDTSCSRHTSYRYVQGIYLSTM